MRNIPSYKWEDVLEEIVPRTWIGLEYLQKEKETEMKSFERNKRKK